jgi:hypothetical protein
MAFLSRTARGGLATLLIAFATAGCAGAATSAPGGGLSSPVGDAGSPTVPGGQVASSAASGPTTGHIGQTLTWFSGGGNQVDVTIVKIIDPASASDTPPADNRWVGVEMTILDHQGDASNFDSAKVDGMGSDGHRHGANDSRHPSRFPGCTPSTGYTPGQPETVCTGFALPTGVTVASIGYGVVGVDIGGPDDLVWTVP